MRALRLALRIWHALGLPESRESLAYRLFLLHEACRNDHHWSLRRLFPARRRRNFT